MKYSDLSAGQQVYTRGLTCLPDFSCRTVRCSGGRDDFCISCGDGVHRLDGQVSSTGDLICILSQDEAEEAALEFLSTRLPGWKANLFSPDPEGSLFSVRLSPPMDPPQWVQEYVATTPVECLLSALEHALEAFPDLTTEGALCKLHWTPFRNEVSFIPLNPKTEQ